MDMLKSIEGAKVRKRRSLDEIKKKVAARKKSKSPVKASNQRVRRKIDNSAEQFVAATELLHRLIQSPEVSKQFAPELRTNSRMVYTKGVTLWMLILQRLGNGLSLEATVSHLLAHDSDLPPDNKRVREGTLSENSSGYQKARKHLPLASIHEFSLVSPTTVRKPKTTSCFA